MPVSIFCDVYDIMIEVAQFFIDLQYSLLFNFYDLPIPQISSYVGSFLGCNTPIT